jgi:hypothetical protein
MTARKKPMRGMTAVVNQHGIVVMASWIAIGAVALVAALLLWMLRRSFGSTSFAEMEVSEAELGVGQQKLKIRPSHQDVQIAHKLWVEVSTRKIGLPIDLEHDVVAEVYDSWYAFFGVTRELIKDIPAVKIRRSQSTRQLVNIAVAVLNEGIRPHLTTWQARFGRWYERALQGSDGAELAPQELQKQFPKYEELLADLLAVNQRLMNYRRMLHDVARGH